MDCLRCGQRRQRFKERANKGQKGRGKSPQHKHGETSSTEPVAAACIPGNQDTGGLSGTEGRTACDSSKLDTIQLQALTNDGGQANDTEAVIKTVEPNRPLVTEFGLRQGGIDGQKDRNDEAVGHSSSTGQHQHGNEDRIESPQCSVTAGLLDSDDVIPQKSLGCPVTSSRHYPRKQTTDLKSAAQEDAWNTPASSSYGSCVVISNSALQQLSVPKDEIILVGDVNTNSTTTTPVLDYESISDQQLLLTLTAHTMEMETLAHPESPGSQVSFTGSQISLTGSQISITRPVEFTPSVPEAPVTEADNVTNKKTVTYAEARRHSRPNTTKMSDWYKDRKNAKDKTSVCRVKIMNYYQMTNSLLTIKDLAICLIGTYLLHFDFVECLEYGIVILQYIHARDFCFAVHAASPNNLSKQHFDHIAWWDVFILKLHNGIYFKIPFFKVKGK